ncbi:hypothetical protein [Marivirga harenae]|uniref:hypothetical protein n=1 Tax=Marivirga harenae TaxID=2010992 RepID=UPI0026E10AF6|nr:hypothetical protein [Marivirga harenae]WKV10548.1 hypothetical protein Q3Y49_10015 [Marivirga harenae]
MKTLREFKLKKGTVLLLGIVIGILSLQACQQDEEMTIDSEEQAEEIELVENTTLAEDNSDQEVSLADLAELEVASSSQRSANCFTSTWDSESNVLTIDFGDGCVGPYGKERSGKILVSYVNEGTLYISDRIITFDNYFVNNIEVTGEIFIVRAEENENGNYQNTYTLTDFTLIYPNGNTFVSNGSRTREWIEGAGDGDPSTNKFQITGSLNGESTRGVNWSHTIVEPIIVDFSCLSNGSMLRTAGIKEVKFSLRNRERTRTVDYGDGSCDGSYTVTINNRVVTVEG